MTRRVLLRLDQDSIQSDDLASMIGVAQISISGSPEHCYAFSFEETKLDHALLLLGSNKSRFGQDLRHYIRSAAGFFSETPDGFVSMPEGSSDFKRRFSEDLGVAISSLFLVESLGLIWESICHIPTSRSAGTARKTPDFVGFDYTHERTRVYECKGTTRPQDVDRKQSDAKTQLASHQHTTANGLATVLYVPASSNLIPPFLFVSDPPLRLPRLSLPLAVGLHYLFVVEFSGLRRTAIALRDLLDVRIQIEDELGAGEFLRWSRGPRLYRPLFEMLQSTFAEEVENATMKKHEGEEFVGTSRSVTVGRERHGVFTGVRLVQMERVIELLKELTEDSALIRQRVATFLSGSLEQVSETSFSLFPDGSLYSVEKPSSAS